MTDKFNCTTVVYDVNQAPHWFEAGDDIPDWCEEGKHYGSHVVAKKSDTEDQVDYHEKTVRQLHKIAEDRGQEISSNKKDDIISELEDWDGAQL